MQAMIVISSFAILSLLLPPLFLLSLAAIALVSLRNGIKDGMIVIAGASLAMAIFGLFLFGNFLVLPIYGLTLWIPIFLIALVLRDTGQLALTVEILVIFGVIAVIFLYMTTAEPSSFWDTRLKNIFDKLANPSKSISAQDLHQVHQKIELVSQYMTGIVTSMTLVCLTLGLLLGRWWQSVLYNPGGFRAEFLNLSTHRIVAYVSLGLFFISLMANNFFTEFTRNAVLIPAVIFIFVGIAVLHKIIANAAAARFILPALYCFILFVPYTLIPVTIIGFADSWLNWRNMFLTS